MMNIDVAIGVFILLFILVFGIAGMSYLNDSYSYSVGAGRENRDLIVVSEYLIKANSTTPYIMDSNDFNSEITKHEEKYLVFLGELPPSIQLENVKCIARLIADNSTSKIVPKRMFVCKKAN